MEDQDGRQYTPELRRYALGCLARREYCRSQLRRKLAARCSVHTAVEELLNALEEDGQLSELRYAEDFLYSRVRRGYGPLRIRSELMRCGIARDCIEQVISSDKYDWAAQARAAWSKKFAAHVPQDSAERARQSRYLHDRGFTPEMFKPIFSEPVAADISEEEFE